MGILYTVLVYRDTLAGYLYTSTFIWILWLVTSNKYTSAVYRNSLASYTTVVNNNIFFSKI